MKSCITTRACQRVQIRARHIVSDASNRYTLTKAEARTLHHRDQRILRDRQLKGRITTRTWKCIEIRARHIVGDPSNRHALTKAETCTLYQWDQWILCDRDDVSSITTRSSTRDSIQIYTFTIVNYTLDGDRFTETVRAICRSIDKIFDHNIDNKGSVALRGCCYNRIIVCPARRISDTVDHNCLSKTERSINYFFKVIRLLNSQCCGLFAIIGVRYCHSPGSGGQVRWIFRVIHGNRPCYCIRRCTPCDIQTC